MILSTLLPLNINLTTKLPTEIEGFSVTNGSAYITYKVGADSVTKKLGSIPNINFLMDKSGRSDTNQYPKLKIDTTDYSTLKFNVYTYNTDSRGVVMDTNYLDNSGSYMQVVGENGNLWKITYAQNNTIPKTQDVVLDITNTDYVSLEGYASSPYGYYFEFANVRLE